jgi:hypothetical protein
MKVFVKGPAISSSYELTAVYIICFLYELKHRKHSKLLKSTSSVLYKNGT